MCVTAIDQVIWSCGQDDLEYVCLSDEQRQFLLPRQDGFGLNKHHGFGQSLRSLGLNSDTYLPYIYIYIHTYIHNLVGLEHLDNSPSQRGWPQELPGEHQPWPHEPRRLQRRSPQPWPRRQPLVADIFVGWL